MADVPMLVISDSTSSERRITPSWTITLLRGKLEHITGVPPSSQRLSIKTPAGTTPIEAANEDATTLDGFPLVPYAELHVSLFRCQLSLLVASCLSLSLLRRKMSRPRAVSTIPR